VGDLEIRSGGVVAVDTASLRAAADRLEACGVELEVVAGLLRRTTQRVEAIPRIELVGAVGRAARLSAQSSALAVTPPAISDRLRTMAAVFETIELRAERAAAVASGDSAALAGIDARLADLRAQQPSSDWGATWDSLWRMATWSLGLTGQFGMDAASLGSGVLLTLGGAAWGIAAPARLAGRGTIEPDSRLGGTVQPVQLRVVRAPGHTTAQAPATLAAVAARIPAGDARVRVERYTMADGSRQFAVYVRGTTSGDDSEPFDMESNLQLYGNEKSASYEAALAALRDAGAQPGDIVHAFGHSQGGMIASRLALEGGFDTRTLVTFGSPVEADVGSETLSVVVRHTDDPVATLAGGGHDDSVGAAGSFVAERSVDPVLTVRDLDPLVAHHMTAYEDTAAMLDASADPRMDAVRAHLAGLEAAASVEVTEYAASRTTSPAASVGATEHAASRTTSPALRGR
jgi:hypothetical protein